MFPEKGDIFLRKWEATMVPKLLKLAALERNEEPLEVESAGNVWFIYGGLLCFLCYLKCIEDSPSGHTFNLTVSHVSPLKLGQDPLIIFQPKK